MAKRIWTGEAAKVRRKTLTAIKRRTESNVGESRLGRMYSGVRKMKEFTRSSQLAAYARAMEITLEESAARVAAQEARLAALGEPWGV